MSSIDQTLSIVVSSSFNNNESLSPGAFPWKSLKDTEWARICKSASISSSASSRSTIAQSANALCSAFSTLASSKQLLEDDATQDKKSRAFDIDPDRSSI